MTEANPAARPPPTTCTIAGRSIEVGALNMGQLLKAVALFDSDKLKKLSAEGDLFDIIEALPEECIRLCVIATDLTREEIDKAAVDEFVMLLAAILDRNHDFFVRRLGPSLKALVDRVLKIATQAAVGSMLTKRLSKPGTPSKRSTGTRSRSSKRS